jgi:hypothetical protein
MTLKRGPAAEEASMRSGVAGARLSPAVAPTYSK